MNNLRGLLGIRRMDRAPNARIRELCGVGKGLGEGIDEGFLRWRGWRVYLGKCAGSRSVLHYQRIGELL